MTWNPSGFPEGFHPERLILGGIETEYGFTVEGHGPHDQIEDAIAFVRSFRDGCFEGWNYRHESPRNDLRGFAVDRLTQDPEDARFDSGRDASRPSHDERSDRILGSGARFYNDHGHPEFATPECFDLDELCLHDAAGESVVLRAGRMLEERLGQRVRVYKNNTDFHGASYGTHESFLLPRKIGFEDLFRGLVPMLVARIVLTGAGKVGSEASPAANYQISARADFFTESANVETLYRRPVMNTRDEPHADPDKWQRLHVICGDANMIPGCTRRKVGLVRLALCLIAEGIAPRWDIHDPALALRSLSRSPAPPFAIEGIGDNSTTAEAILESYFTAYENRPQVDPPASSPDLPGPADYSPLIAECRQLMQELRLGDEAAIGKIDWTAKRRLIEMAMEEEGLKWGRPELQSYDLEYHNADPAEGLYFAMAGMGMAEAGPSLLERAEALASPGERTRGWVRGLAVEKFSDSLITGCWRSITFKSPDGRSQEVFLDPYRIFPEHLGRLTSVDSFISCLT